MQKLATVMVWDKFIRIFHWSLLLAFIIAYLSSGADNDLHIYSGYVVLGLVIARIVWGLIGSKHALFSDFIQSPATVSAYLKAIIAGHPQRYLGHNPVGGCLVIALLSSLLLVTISGLEVYALETGAGLLSGKQPLSLTDTNDDQPELSVAPFGDEELARDDAYSAEEFWEAVHEWSTNFMLVLIALHIFGVLLASHQHKESLVKAMLTGEKREED